MADSLDDPRVHYLLITLAELFGEYEWAAHDPSLSPTYLNHLVIIKRDGKEFFEYDLKRGIIKRLSCTPDDYVFTPTYTHYSWWTFPLDDDELVRGLLVQLAGLE